MKQRVVVAVAVLVVLVLGAGAYVALRPAPPAASGAVAPPAPVSARPVPPPAAGTPATAPPAAGTSASLKLHRSSLPPLVAGNPLTDDQFAAISAKVIIAAEGLKHDQNWQQLVLTYMDQTLQKEGLTAAQYQEYAEALYHNPDRGRAVAENTMGRVQKKLGTRVDMKTLPFMKYDQETIEKLKHKLEK